MVTWYYNRFVSLSTRGGGDIGILCFEAQKGYVTVKVLIRLLQQLSDLGTGVRLLVQNVQILEH